MPPRDFDFMGPDYDWHASKRIIVLDGRFNC